MQSNQVFPVTTNGLSNTSECLSLVAGFGTSSPDSNQDFPNIVMPMYNLGLIYPSSSTNQTTASITATEAPNILTYPYLTCHTNLIASCANQYMGGQNGMTLLPCISPLQTNYSVADFAYVGRSDLQFVVTKPTNITEIKTSIHFPNGELAESILGESSSVIYRIDFAPRATDGYRLEEKEEKDEK